MRVQKKIKIHISEEPHCRELESLGSIFIPLAKGVLSTKDLIEADIILRWTDIVGEKTASFCRPVKARFNLQSGERVLHVEVPVGGFALELQHREKFMLDKINAYFGYRAIHKLNVSQNVNMQIKGAVQKAKVKEETLSEEEKQYLDELTADIKDNKLKEILTKLGKSVILSNREET